MSFVHNDASLAAAAQAAHIALADMPTVLSDPTHPRHGELVVALNYPAAELAAESVESISD